VSIPLTIDWLTLAWLRLRLSLWWKGRRRARLSPRELALAVTVFALAGCVPVTRFEEVQSAAQVEMDGRHRAEYRITQLQAENAALLASAQEKSRAMEQQVEQRDDALAQAELDKATQGKERSDAQGMVEQLRGELARVGGHLQSYHDGQKKLEEELQAETARGRALSRITRDVALSLAEPLTTGSYWLDSEPRHVVLRVPREALLTQDGSVRPEAAALLKSVQHLLVLHPESKLRVEDLSAPGDAVAASRVVTALAVAADRIEPLASAEEGSARGTVAEIALGFSVP
jgi:hypothetical protein